MRRNKLLSLILSISLIVGLINIPIVHADNLLAFPGAEGGGKYTTGARGKSSRTVYHVTNLNDSGSGSLRDAVSGEGRIIVFDVSGVITLKSKLTLSKGNITILGQTAPGDGITISGYDVEIKADNIIMRYLRIRPTDSQGGEPDGLGGRWIDNIIVDHCSVSWGVDEMLTIYSGSLENGKEEENLDPKEQSKNVTVQYCLSAESLRMSNHFKGAHGYGGIIGGTNATYHHNMFAHHDSRNPRMDRNLKSTDMVNNVIYNWGNNVTYGAEPYSYNKWERYSTPEYASNVNIRNNYYKSGPSTKGSIRSKIFEATNSGDVYYNGELAKSNMYIKGNYVYGDEEATVNNTATENNVMNQDKLNLLSSPIDMGDYEIQMQSAEDAFEDVIANVGATLPRRDSIDARIVADAKNGTGRIINKIEEVGGLTGIKSETRTFEIPSDWKSEYGMTSSNKETDIVPAGEWAGYTWIEAYVNDWTEEQSAPTNPDITVISLAVAYTGISTDKTGGKGFWNVESEDTPVRYIAKATPKEDTSITKIELYDGTKLIETVEDWTIDTYISLEAGTHYLTSKAYNTKGEITTSPTSIVYVTKNDNSIGNNTIAEVGTVAFPEDTNVWVKDSKTYIGGSGLINGASDSFSYWKHPVTGDFEFSAKIESIPKYENGALCGIMFRESLDADSRMIMISDGWKKYGENIMVPQRLTTGGAMTLGWMRDSNGNDVANNGSYNTTDESLNLTLPKYMKIARSGDKLTLSVSNDGVTWTNNIRQPLEFDISGWSKNAYIGLAVDSINGSANDGNPMLPWYTIGGFSNIKMTGVTPYNVSFETNGGQITDGAFTTYSYGDAKAMPSVEKTDYYFGGWYDNAAFEGEKVEKMPKTAAGDLTYYVQWLESTPTPTPTPEPVYPASWTASDADIGKVAGDELMTGLTLVSDNTSDSGSYVTHTSNGSINGEDVSGSALKFVAKGDGTLSVTFKDIGGGNPKTIVIYDVEAGVNVASYTTVLNVKETKELTATVEAGKTYYIAGFGTKARYCAAQFTPANGSETPVVSPRPSTEPTPTVEPTALPTATPSPTPEPTAEPTPTVAPTATPTIAPTVTPTVAPTVKPTTMPTVTPTASPTTTPTVKPSPTRVPIPAAPVLVPPDGTTYLESYDFDSDDTAKWTLGTEEQYITDIDGLTIHIGEEASGGNETTFASVTGIERGNVFQMQSGLFGTATRAPRMSVDAPIYVSDKESIVMAFAVRLSAAEGHEEDAKPRLYFAMDSMPQGNDGKGEYYVSAVLTAVEDEIIYDDFDDGYENPISVYITPDEWHIVTSVIRQGKTFNFQDIYIDGATEPTISVTYQIATHSSWTDNLPILTPESKPLKFGGVETTPSYGLVTIDNLLAYKIPVSDGAELLPTTKTIKYDKATNKAIITSPEEKTGTVIFASYDDDGRLVSVSLRTDVNINIGTTEFEPTENFVPTDNVRVYLWNSIRGMTPLE